MFRMRKPRGFQHDYIYVDERKERLAKMEEAAKRELGLEEAKPYSPENIRGKIIEQTTHVRRRQESGRKGWSYGALVAGIIVLLFILNYLVTGSFAIRF